MLESTKIGDNHCPHCNELTDMAASSQGRGPRPGDLSVCIYCGEVGMFQPDMKLRVLDELEKAQLENSPEYVKVLKIRLLIELHKANAKLFARNQNQT